MDIKNSKYNEFGGIDCEIDHPNFGWIPFTANPDDPEELGKRVFEAVKDLADPYVPPSVDEVKAKLEAAVRNERNQLLSASDWTQNPDAPVDKAAWAAYRQALRDVPQQANFPETVIWPERP